MSRKLSGNEVMLARVLRTAVFQFLDGETENILSGVSERNLCGRLAPILENVAKEYRLTEYFADIEYNRKQNGQIKTILDEKFKVITINCDLILHSRGNNVERDNLIAIEMKKSSRSNEEKENDRARLRAMTKSSYDGIWSFDGETHPKHVCGYELGAFVELNSNIREIQIEYFASGNSVGMIERIRF